MRDNNARIFYYNDVTDDVVFTAPTVNEAKQMLRNHFKTLLEVEWEMNPTDEISTGKQIDEMDIKQMIQIGEKLEWISNETIVVVNENDEQVELASRVYMQKMWSSVVNDGLHHYRYE